VTPSPRVNYDRIAHLYDAQPYRAKSVDPELLAFISQRTSPDSLAILDIGCGTGNQLVANRAVAPDARPVGVDRSFGMLRQAQPKAPEIGWVQADGAMLPFPAQFFHFVTCQHAFHHVRDKPGMLEAVFQALRPGGRLVVYGLCPQECPDWLYYEFFPEAHAIDVEDFWPAEAVMAEMEAIGFVAVGVERQHLHYQQNLLEWLEIVRRRDTCSQLLTIADAAYAAGLHRLEKLLADRDAPPVRADHLCFVTIRGERPMGISGQSPGSGSPFE
jgi:ubiquinone/menaquinone biosynthesis C-methylase UbiE